MTAHESQSSTFYDRMWGTWGDFESASPAALHRRLWLSKLVRTHAANAQQVLEIGCGLGAFLADLAEELPRAELYGADASEASVKAAQRACPRAHCFVLDVSAPASEQELAKHRERYDLIVCSEVLEHLAFDSIALTRILALLAPGGHLVVSVPAGERTRFDHAIGHVRHYSEASLRELLTCTGYVVDTAFAWGFPFHSLYRGVVRLASRITLPSASVRPGRLVGFGYRLFGAALKPLYHLNRPYWGEQLFAVAHKP